MKKWLIFFALLVFSLAVFLRFFKLGSMPVSLYWDEIAILVDARSVAETGRDMHGNSMWQAIFPSYGDYKLPVYIWLAGLSVKIFGASEWALRLPSALAGLGTMIFAGLLAKEFFLKDKEIKNGGLLKILVFLTVAVSPWAIMFSRTAFEGHLAQFFVTISIWLVFRKQKWGEWSMVAALIGGLATYTYFSVRFIWPVLFSVLTILFVFNFNDKKEGFLKKWFKPVLFYLALPLFIYFLSLKPMYNSPLYEISNQFRMSTTSVLNMETWPVVSNQYKLMTGNTILDKAIYHPYVLMGRELAQNFADNLSFDFLFLTGDQNLRHGTGQHGLFLWVFLPSFLYGWYRLFPKYWRQGIVLLVWWIASLLPASVPETTPHALRSLNALVPLSIVMGWGTYWLIDEIRKLPVHFRHPLLTVIILIPAFVVFNFTTYLFEVYPAKSATSWQDGYAELAEIIWQEKEGRDTIWIEPFDGRFHLWVMGYEMSVSEFHETEYEKYVPKRLSKNIVVAPFDWAKVKTMEPKTIVAGRKETIDRELELSPVKPTWYKTINTADGETPFVVVYFEK